MINSFKFRSVPTDDAMVGKEKQKCTFIRNCELKIVCEIEKFHGKNSCLELRKKISAEM